MDAQFVVTAAAAAAAAAEYTPFSWLPPKMDDSQIIEELGWDRAESVSLCFDVVTQSECRPPAVRHSMLTFDMLMFDEIFLIIYPIALLLCLARGTYLCHRPPVARGSKLLASKLILWHIVAALQVVVLVLALVHGGSFTPSYALAYASHVLGVLSSVLFIFLSKTEHDLSPAPSALLQLFLLLTLALDVERVREEWFRSWPPYTVIGLVQVAVKIALLVAESTHKEQIIAIPASRVSREERYGAFGRSLQFWVNPLLQLGYKKDLVLDDLEDVDEALSSERVLERLTAAWKNVDQTQNNALAFAVLKAFWPELLLIHIPRLGMVAFGLAQPILVQTTIEYIQKHETRSVNDGYGLIAAFAFTYLGIAISILWSGQLATRLLTRIRGALIAVIYTTMLSLRAESGTSQAAVALMSTEVERIVVAAEWCLAAVPNLVQVAFAMWILGTQLGAVCIAPVLIAILSVSAATRTGKLIPPRQRRWMQAIQRRVGVTTDIVGSVKGVKMSGLTAVVRSQIQGLREFELDESKRFRRVQIANVLIGQFPSIMTPSITFAAFALLQRFADGSPLNVVQAFTSLSLLAILINPVSELVMIPHNLGSTIACLSRIQEFLVKEKRVDYRVLAPNPSPSSPLVKVSRGAFAWHPSQKPILHSLDLEIAPAALTVLVGPVGCGKSTLLKSLVGETRRVAGAVEYANAAALEVAYCDQDPWILNMSIRDNIVNGAEYDAGFYEKVIAACQLEEDLRLLPQRDETVVGSSGSALSGGQKHRIALARAVYSGKPLLIMDDTLKGLDSNTASKCFAALLGSQGLLRSQNRAVLFATHNAQWLRSADHIIALTADGTVAERGSFDELSKAGGYVSTLRISSHDEDAASQEEGDNKQTNGDAKKVGPAEAAAKPNGTDKKARARGAANTSSLLYYIKSMGTSAFLLFVAMVLFQMGCRTMQRLWVKFWVASNERGGDENLGMWVGLYILWGCLTELSVAIETFFFLVIVVPHSAKGLHFGVLKAALAAPLSFFVKTDTGVIINRFSQDMNLVDLPLPLGFMLTFDCLTLATSELILTCLATGYLALAIPFLGLALYTIQRVYLQTSRQVRLLDLEAKSPIFSHFIASFSGLVTIRALNRAAAARSENLARIDASQRPFYALGSLQRWLLLVLNLTVAALAVLLVTLAVAMRGSIDPGLLGVALVSVMGFGQLLTTLLKYWADLETSLGAVARIRQFETETPTEKDGGESPSTEWPSQGRIEIRDVSAAYDDHQVLSNVNLEFQPGEKVAICGRTGSGKSTLVALLLRLHDPSAGKVAVDGVDIFDIEIDKLRESLVALPQDALFLPGTVRRNLDPFDARDNASIWDALDKAGLKGLFEDKGGLETDLDTDWLSAGQKQLFCMARALLRNSRVLVLDEATSSLDQATEQVVQDLIRSEFQGWTVIVIAHRLRAIVDFDKVVALQDGQVVEFDHPKTLLERGGVFASLWKLQEGDLSAEA